MKRILIAILGFLGITSVAGGSHLIITNGSGMPAAWLENSPFSSFFLPGIILVLIIGGLSIASSLFLIKNRPFQFELSAISGFGVLIWIFVQQYIIRQSSFLQIAYFGIGIIILILTFFLLKSSLHPRKED